MQSDTYKTIREASASPVYKEKKSKFYGYAFPVTDKNTVTTRLEQLRLDHPAARHICYAWCIGVDQKEFRASDDGEPHNSAGQPILGQIRAFDVTDILVAVVRYYGGTKLGVGGLITAYKWAARSALENAEIRKMEIREVYRLRCGYENTGKVLHIIEKNQWEILSREMTQHCELIVGVRVTDVEKFELQFNNSKTISFVRLERD